MNQSTEIPLQLEKCMLKFDSRIPTSKELEENEYFDITLDMLWNPKLHNDDASILQATVVGEKNKN